MLILVTGGAGFIGANPSPSCCDLAIRLRSWTTSRRGIAATSLVHRGDRELAERLGHGARETARDLEGTPDRYAASVRRLVEQMLAET